MRGAGGRIMLAGMDTSGRGAVAAIVLPACYVGVPYLIGIFAARSFLRPSAAVRAPVYD
jgi:hypothetical protein